MLQIGDIRIHHISDGITYMDAGGAFGLVPKALWQKVMPDDGNNLVPMILNCLLVQAGGQNILVDTGVGDKLTEKQREVFWHLKRDTGGVVDGLARVGLRPEDVHLVVNTHLHGDHSGGNTTYDANGKIVPTFPNATYVVQRREFEDATHPNERTRATYLPENFMPVQERGQLRLLDGDTELAPGVYGVVTPGHTPGHMSVRFESRGEQGLFVCDMASFAVHFERLGWMTAYDVEPLVTLETKRKWQQWALETKALLLFAHDEFRPAGRLRLDESGKPSLETVEIAHV